MPAEAAAETLRRRYARKHLIDFTAYTKPDFQVATHHFIIANALDEVEKGNIDRLMIFTPPRHTKSELASRRFPAYAMGRNPRRQIICATYNGDFATDFGRDVRDIVAGREYRALFNTSLRPDSKAANKWKTSQGGIYLSAGIGCGITGKGADIALIDDPDKDRKEADSKTFRDAKWKWYTSTFYTRLMPGGAIVIIMTRWHEDDIAGRLLEAQEKGGDQWTIIKLPALAEADDLMGRQPGEALWPAWYDKAALQKIKIAIGSSDFEALYQQNPSIASGMIFMRAWWQYYKEPPVFKRILQSWDTAFKTGQENDFSVCTTWGEAKNGYYLIDLWQEKVEYPELKRAILQQNDKHRPHTIVIEDTAAGASAIQELKRETRIPLIAIDVDSDKIARSKAVTPLIEAGKVFLPEKAPWVGDYVTNLAKFPNAAHDDDVDSTTQALNHMTRGSKVGLIDFYQNIIESAKKAA